MGATSMVAIKMPAREFVRNYKIPLIATILLIILVIFMTIFHQYSLSKVDTIIKGSPLISTEGEKLISQDQSTSTAIDPTGDDVTVNPNAPASHSETPSTGTGSGLSTPSGSTGAQSGGGSSTPSQPGNPSQPSSPALTASITNISSMSKENCILGLLSCTTDYTFTGTISVNNGPGIIQYRWERSNGTIGVPEQKTVTTGTSTITTTHTWTSAPKNGWVKLRILAPNQTEKQYSFGS